MFLKRITLLSILLLFGFAMSSAQAFSARSDGENLHLIKRFPFKGGLEIASSGDFVYASQWNGHYNRAEEPTWGGVRIFDVSGELPEAAGALDCPGFDNDVAVVRPGVIALGYGENVCARNPKAPGVLFADVSDPARPRVLADVEVYYAHTISVYPGRSLVYASTGGWLPVGNDGRIDIIDASDPRKPEVVGNFTFDGFGCHDISFRITKESKLAFCTTSSPLQLILDVSDPIKPEIVGRILNPLIQYGHTAIASPDGKLLAITDEAFVAHECDSGVSPVGGLWLYDISDPTLPKLEGYRALGEGRAHVGNILDGTPSYCTAAMIDWMPDGRLISSWYSGGVEVLDVTNPVSPEVIATYRPKDSLAYGVDFYQGRIYVNDIDRGLEVLELREN
jgi:hypothetical protein